MDDIIYAKASGGGAAAISIVRLTGAGSHRLVQSLLRGSKPKPRQAALRRVFDGETGELIDQALVLLFEQGASYTGEESAELHLHGGEAVSAAIFTALERVGARLAQPGEYTRRALANGSLDLAQAESVGALIAAESAAERRQALRGLEGEVGELATRWRDSLISMIGLLETGVDFVEEELGEELVLEVADRLFALQNELDEHVKEASRVDLRRDRPVVVLVGPPNAGKSSLLNAIAGVDRAIVSAIPGTTRDTVDVTMRISGREIMLADTAGLRDSDDVIEQAGVARTRAQMQSADQRIFVVSADTWSEFQALLPEIRAEDAVFWSKSDLEPPSETALSALPGQNCFSVSARAPHEARRAIERFLERSQRLSEAPVSPLIGSERRIALLRSADPHLRQAATGLQNGAAELAIEDLRRAAAHLAALTGKIDQEDVLDALFSRFCIGK